MILYFIISLINVFLHIVRSILVIKSGKFVASLSNCICYTFSAVVIKFIGDKFDYHPGKRYDSSVYKFSITDKNKSIEIGKFLYKNFQYPFGHPKKASTWIKRLEIDYPIANFKDPQFMIIRPYWIDNCTPEAIFTFLHSISCSEDAYTSIRLGGHSPQQAREVLPLCTKSELIMTGFEDDWNNFLDIRLKGTTGRPHPDMVELAQMIQDELNKIQDKQ